MDEVSWSWLWGLSQGDAQSPHTCPRKPAPLGRNAQDPGPPRLHPRTPEPWDFGISGAF